MKKLIKAVSVVLAALMLLTTLSVVSFADTPAKYTLFEGEQVLDGWYPSFFLQYAEPEKASNFLEAIQNDGATIEITYTGSANLSLLLQSYPVSGGDNYSFATFSRYTTKTDGDKKVAVFSAEDFIDTYTSTKHADDGSYLRLDNVMNFGVDGNGNTVYSIIVRWTIKGDPGITVDLDTRYQTFEGWGASYTWYGDWLTNNVHAEEAYDWIFEDAEFNILRFRDLNKVIGYGGGYEDTTYKSYKAYYNAAVKRGVDPIVMVTSWGQYDRNLDFVAFTEKDDEGHTYYTLAKDENGEYMYDELADFCVQSIQYFFDAGIPVDYFSISNETELQGLHIDEQGNARDEAGFYFGPDENEYHCAYWKAHIAVYEAFQEAFGEDAPKITGAEVMADTASLMEEYLEPLIEAAPESFDMIPHHLYGSANTPASFSEVYEKFGDYTLWQTEWYNNDYFGHAKVLIDELNYENVNAYLYWNGVWPEDDGNCLIEIGGWESNAYVKPRGNHYIMMHFSKFIKNGYTRVETDLNAVNSDVTAFVSPDNDELVLVILNTSENDETLKLAVNDYRIKSGHIYRSTKNTDDYEKEQEFNEYMADMGSLKTTSIEIPSDTLTTLVMKIEPRDAEAADEEDTESADKTETAAETVEKPKTYLESFYEYYYGVVKGYKF